MQDTAQASEFFSAMEIAALSTLFPHARVLAQNEFRVSRLEVLCETTYTSRA